MRKSVFPFFDVTLHSEINRRSMKKLIIQLLTLLAVGTANAQNPYLPLWEHVPDGEPRVFEDPDKLFNLHGIGFSKKDKPLQVPVVPQVTITADGKRLVIPADPIRTTNANGYTDLTYYQVYAPLKAGSQLKVQADVPGVEITVSPVVEGRATIKCVYQGKEKIYLIN